MWELLGFATLTFAVSAPKERNVKEKRAGGVYIANMFICVVMSTGLLRSTALAMACRTSSAVAPSCQHGGHGGAMPCIASSAGARHDVPAYLSHNRDLGRSQFDLFGATMV